MPPVWLAEDDANLPFLSKWDLLRLLRFTTQPSSPPAPASEYLNRLAYLRLLVTHACSAPSPPVAPNKAPPITVRDARQHAVPDRVLIEHALFGMDERLADEVRGCAGLVGTGFHKGEEEAFGVLRPRMDMVYDVEGRGIGLTWAKFERIVADCEDRLTWRTSNLPNESNHDRVVRASSATTQVASSSEADLPSDGGIPQPGPSHAQRPKQNGIHRAPRVLDLASSGSSSYEDPPPSLAPPPEPAPPHPVKRGPGRPRKHPLPAALDDSSDDHSFVPNRAFAPAPRPVVAVRQPARPPPPRDDGKAPILPPATTRSSVASAPVQAGAAVAGPGPATLAARALNRSSPGSSFSPRIPKSPDPPFATLLRPALIPAHAATSNRAASAKPANGSPASSTASTATSSRTTRRPSAPPGRSALGPRSSQGGPARRGRTRTPSAREGTGELGSSPAGLVTDARADEPRKSAARPAGLAPMFGGAGSGRDVGNMAVLMRLSSSSDDELPKVRRRRSPPVGRATANVPVEEVVEARAVVLSRNGKLEQLHEDFNLGFGKAMDKVREKVTRTYRTKKGARSSQFISESDATASEPEPASQPPLRPQPSLERWSGKRPAPSSDSNVQTVYQPERPPQRKKLKRRLSDRPAVWPSDEDWDGDELQLHSSPAQAPVPASEEMSRGSARLRKEVVGVAQEAGSITRGSPLAHTAEGREREKERRNVPEPQAQPRRSSFLSNLGTPNPPSSKKLAVEPAPAMRKAGGIEQKVHQATRFERDASAERLRLLGRAERKEARRIKREAKAARREAKRKASLGSQQGRLVVGDGEEEIDELNE